MEASFHHRLINGPFEDPALYVRILREKRAILFDIGDIGRLTAAELYKVTDVFVTHTHVDHFIGFDTLLRAVLKREAPLNIYGPAYIASCVAGKLRGYAWNLIRDYPTTVNVFAWDGRTTRHSVFRARDRFRQYKVSSLDARDGILLRSPAFSVRAARLTHDIACLAFSIEEEMHINIDKEVLRRKGLSVGPWLGVFKSLLREGADPEAVLVVDALPRKIGGLTEIARIAKGQKISYATDIAITRINISRLVDLAGGSDVFYLEAYFLDEDRERAIERFHLTAKTCGAIARKAGAKKLVPIHFSPKYSDRPETVIDEAMKEFGQQ